MVVSSVSSPGVVNHLKRFLDDIVFISKTQDMCRKQSEVVSALQSHFETQSHFKRLKKKNYPHANQRQLSLYTEGVAHLRKRNSSTKETPKNKNTRPPVIKGPTRRQYAQYVSGVTKLSQRNKVENESRSDIPVKEQWQEYKKHLHLVRVDSALSKLHRQLPELYDGLRTEVESLPNIRRVKKERTFLKKQDRQASAETDVTLAPTYDTHSYNSNGSSKVIFGSNRSKERENEVVVDKKSSSKTSSHRKSTEDTCVPIIGSETNQFILQVTVGSMNHDTTEHVRELDTGLGKMNINFECTCSGDDIEMVLGPTA